MKLDINADVGEGLETDAALLAIVSSANIACGQHAGDEATMRATVTLCLRNGVGIGAHPGYADRANFGRVALSLSAAEVTGLISSQVKTLMGIAAGCGGRVAHVKPHGALSNQAMQDLELARAIARGIKAADGQLIFLAPAGTAMVQAGQEEGLRVAQEIFADRAYDDRGFLVARNHPGAVLHDPTKIATRILGWLKSGRLTTVSGNLLALSAQSICVHGDTPEAVDIAVTLRDRLETAMVAIAPLSTFYRKRI